MLKLFYFIDYLAKNHCYSLHYEILKLMFLSSINIYNLEEWGPVVVFFLFHLIINQNVYPHNMVYIPILGWDRFVQSVLMHTE